MSVASSLLDRVRIVLVGTTHPGNIGAAARAMKTMGLSRLALVEPREFPSAQATARAAGADDLLVRAELHADLAGALHDTVRAYATTSRAREIEWPLLSPREFAAAALHSTGAGPLAVVFGRENSGLTNAELDLCDGSIRIPADPGFSSLNLGMAVQVIAYELRVAALAAEAAAAVPAPVGPVADPPAGWAATERLHAHLLQVMQEVGYLNPQRPKLLARRVRRWLARSQLLHSEAQFLRGFLTEIQARLKRTGADER
jgi:TrmH family RNA methyltransferase